MRKKMWTRTATRVIQVTNKTEVILFNVLRIHRGPYCGRNRYASRRVQIMRCKMNSNRKLNASERARKGDVQGKRKRAQIVLFNFYFFHFRIVNESYTDVAIGFNGENTAFDILDDGLPVV